jgi:predicted transposase YdaD
MKEVQTPHNNFVKEFFDKIDNAVSFFENYLPKEVLQHIDLKTLKPKKDSFIDKELSEYFADLLYRVNFKNKSNSLGYIYMLLEHKSYQDSFTDFQLLKYMVQIWDNLLKQKKKNKEKKDKQDQKSSQREQKTQKDQDEFEKQNVQDKQKDQLKQETQEQSQHKRKPNSLPVIIPLVLYHGKTKWPYGNEFKQHFECPDDFKIYIPNFQYILQDLSQIPDEQIVGTVFVRVFYHILKYIHHDEIVEKLPGILNLLAELKEKNTALEYLETILRYLASTVPEEKISFEELKEIINESFTKKGGNIMQTIADKLRNEGRVKWMNEGEQNAQKKFAISMHTKGMSLYQIADYLDIDQKKISLFIQETDLISTDLT